MVIKTNFPVIIIFLSLLSLLSGLPGICYGNPGNGNRITKADLVISKLECEFKTNPATIDQMHPRMSWIIKSSDLQDRNQYQSAYCIQVASSLENLCSGRCDLWDSHLVTSSKNNNVPYAGFSLRSGVKYFWRVKVWDKSGRPSPWSQPAFWTMGLLHNCDWGGKWVMDSRPYPRVDSLRYGDLPAPLFRKGFLLSAGIKKAVLYISGLGYYEAYINGHRIGNHYLDPGWTDYSKRVFYSSYDVTPNVRMGKNCIGVMLGNGWYNPLPLKMWGRKNLRKALTIGQPRFILQMNITYNDGKTISIVSAKDWKVTDGPVIRNNIYLGVVLDDRRIIKGWDEPGFNTGRWRKVIYAQPPPGKLQSQPEPAIIIADTLTPGNIRKIGADKYIVDFGRNFGGIIRLSVKGKASTRITIRYGELLYPNGSLNVMTSVAGQIKVAGTGGPGAPDTACAGDTFILNGKGKETFQPPFTFHGFRYAEVSGYPGILRPEDMEGLVMHASVPAGGTFRCSDTLINQIQQACRNTFLSNLFSVESDCPHRERFGYGGDMTAVCEAFMNNFTMSTFYPKCVQDFADEAQPDGGLTETAPYVGISDEGLGGKSGPVEWGSVVPVLLYRIYQYYGDMDLVKRQYKVARHWVDFISSKTNNGIITKALGDWESIDANPVDVSGTAFYYYDAYLVSYFAKLLHRQGDEIKYSRLAKNIKAAFIKQFENDSTGGVGIHTEATQSYALFLGLVPSLRRKAALQVLLNDIDSAHNKHVSTGMFATMFLLKELSTTGHGNLAYQMVDQKTYPGWGYMIARGATTLWEHWGFSDNTYSHNHPMLGSVSEWFYQHVAGIRPGDHAAGYNKIIICPDIIPGLSWAKADYHSINGLIESNWQKDGKQFKLQVIIPVNTTAKIYVPAQKITSITEKARNILRDKSIKVLGIRGSYVVLKAGSGNYEFTSTL